MDNIIPEDVATAICATCGHVRFFLCRSGNAAAVSAVLTSKAEGSTETSKATARASAKEAKVKGSDALADPGVSVRSAYWQTADVHAAARLVTGREHTQTSQMREEKITLPKVALAL